jgi:chemotaxis protein MotB
MARRAKKHEHVNHERWLVSYADFITLLFAFFVVMFSVSRVDGKKLTHFEDSVGVAFRFPPVGGRMGSVLTGGGGGNSIVPSVVSNRPSIQRYWINSAVRERLLENLARQLTESKLGGTVALREEVDGIVLELPADDLFAPGTPGVRVSSLDLLRTAASLVAKERCPIRVDVHTDDRPVEDSPFDTAWELASVRAAGVARFLSRTGVEASRLSGCGYYGAGAVADGPSDANARRARRVDLVLVVP